MLILKHLNHQTTLPNKALIIIEQASEADYFNLANEDLKLEFDGESLYIHSPATKKHENLVFELLKLCKHALEDQPQSGEAIGSHFALLLPNGKRPEPDIVVTAWGDVQDEDAFFEGVPLLVIEVTSPSTRTHDLTRKLLWYQEAKIPEIWILDRGENAFLFYQYESKSDMYHLVRKTEGLYQSQLLPNLSIIISDYLEESKDP